MNPRWCHYALYSLIRSSDQMESGLVEIVVFSNAKSVCTIIIILESELSIIDFSKAVPLNDSVLHFSHTRWIPELDLLCLIYILRYRVWIVACFYRLAQSTVLCRDCLTEVASITHNGVGYLRIKMLFCPVMLLMWIVMSETLDRTLELIDIIVAIVNRIVIDVKQTNGMEITLSC